MIQAFSEYIRSIAVFLIFISFVSIITPQKKYKEYIDLVLALILIFIVISPLDDLFGVFNGNSSDLFANTSFAYNKSVLLKEEKYYEESQNDIILSQYANELSGQLKRIIETGGNFAFIESNFSLDKSKENFGSILSISVTVSEKTPKATKKPFVRIQKVNVSVKDGKNEDKNSTDVETSQIKELKNKISDFYQLSVQHIYIVTAG